MPPDMPAAKLRPTAPSIDDHAAVMYSQPWSPTPSTTAVAPELRTANRSPARPRNRPRRRSRRTARRCRQTTLSSAAYRRRPAGATTIRPPDRPLPHVVVDLRRPELERHAARGERAEALAAGAGRAASRGVVGGRLERRASSPASIVPTERSVLRIGVVDLHRPRRARAAPTAIIQRWSAAGSRPCSCGSVRHAAPARPAGASSGSRSRSFSHGHWRASTGRRRSVRPTRSSNRRTPTAAISSRTRSATNSEVRAPRARAVPVNRRRSSGSCVAIPTGHVFRWQTRIITQPSATSGAVENANSSAPSSARDQRRRAPVRRPPSTCTRTRPRRPFIDQHLLRLGEAELPRQPCVLQRRQRRRAGAAVVPGDHDVLGLRLGDAGRDRADAGLG